MSKKNSKAFITWHTRAQRKPGSTKIGNQEKGFLILTCGLVEHFCFSLASPLSGSLPFRRWLGFLVKSSPWDKRVGGSTFEGVVFIVLIGLHMIAYSKYFCIAVIRSIYYIEICFNLSIVFSLSIQSLCRSHLQYKLISSSSTSTKLWLTQASWW